MDLKAVTVLFVVIVSSQTIAGQSRPAWCRNRQTKSCSRNACDVLTCPAYPDAVCLNDNPCEPLCSGHFYVEGRPRLSRTECRGEGHGPPGIPDWCPRNSHRMRCFAHPCSVMTCKAKPQAKCFADDPCSPSCSGNFYIGRQRLSQSECRTGNRN